ncbi:DUF4179 domain-containing protein [Clostridium sp. HCS.1]|uniref:DUF4179 domain-containing protein n=1 Tax=Clostridium sp. HCS.1 TaxID=3238594 RepID=UPI003A0FB8FB
MYKKSYDNINIPSNISLYVEAGIRKAEKEKKLKKRKLIISVATLTLTFLIIGVANSNVIAEEIPILRDIFKILENSNLQEAPKNNYSDYSKEVGITKESNGIKITVQEAVYDGTSILVSYIIENTEGFPYKTYSYPQDYVVLEDNIVVGGENYVKEPITWIYLEADVRFSFNQNNQLLMSRHAPEGMMIDDNTFIGIQRYELSNTDDKGEIVEPIPDNFDLNININAIYLPPEIQKFDESILEKDYRYFVEGNWNFSIPLELEKKLIKTYEINEEKDGFLLKKITETPFTLTLEVIPLREENQKVVKDELGRGGKTMQLQSLEVIGSDGVVYGNTMPGVSYSNFSDNNEIEGTMYCTISKLNKDIENYKVQVKDYTRNSKEGNDSKEGPKIIDFEVKVKNTFE